MDVIGVQLDTVWEDKAANVAKVAALLDAAPIEAGSLLVLPEMFATGFSMNVAAVAEGAAREAESFLSATAARLGAAVVGGVVTTAPDGRGRNEAVAFDPSGREIARYAKMHPFSFAGEAEHYAAGGHVVTFDWGGFTVAPTICYDLRFPELFRAAVRRGADLFAVIANWPEARADDWTTLLRARAIENQAYVVGVNRCGADPANAYGGGSLVVGPRGEIVADAGAGECVFRARLDLPALRAWRREFPALEDMREADPPPAR